MAKTFCQSCCWWLNHQTAKFIACCWPVCHSRTFKILNSKHSGVTRPHSSCLEAGFYVYLSKWEVIGISDNTRRAVYCSCLILDYSTASCSVLMPISFWMDPSLLCPVAGVGEYSEVRRYTWQCHSFYNKVLPEVCISSHDCWKVSGCILLCYGKYSSWSPPSVKKKGRLIHPLVGHLTRQESWCIDFLLVHHAF